jgi:hypothetical protein
MTLISVLFGDPYENIAALQMAASAIHSAEATISIFLIILLFLGLHPKDNDFLDIKKNLPSKFTRQTLYK